MNIPEITSCGFSGTRYFSMMNPWIDFVVVSPTNFQPAIEAAIEDAFNDYWNEDFETYGDALEHYLRMGGYPFMIFYHDGEDTSAEYEKDWELFLNQLRFLLIDEMKVIGALPHYA